MFRFDFTARDLLLNDESFHTFGGAFPPLQYIIGCTASNFLQTYYYYCFCIYTVPFSSSPPCQLHEQAVKFPQFCITDPPITTLLPMLMIRI